MVAATAVASSSCLLASSLQRWMSRRAAPIFGPTVGCMFRFIDFHGVRVLPPGSPFPRQCFLHVG